MAINVRQRFPLRQARAHRVQMPRYLRLDGGRYLIAAALLLSFMSLLTLGQTGRLAAKGYAMAQLEHQKTLLLRERSSLLMQLSEAQSLDEIQRRATQLQLRPVKPDQVRYMRIPASTAQDQPAATTTPRPASTPAAVAP